MSKTLNRIGENGNTEAVNRMAKEQGYVYVFSLGLQDLYKIGYASDWKRRLGELEAGNPMMTCIMAFPFHNPHKVEKHLHSRYREEWMGREIFLLEMEDLQEICDNLYDASICGGIISKDLEGEGRRWEWKNSDNFENVFPQLRFKLFE